MRFPHLYNSKRWRYLRERRLNAEPLCRFCLNRQRVEPAIVVDHIRPHRGNEALFFDYSNTQSLCKRCHDSGKQVEEGLGYSDEVGVNGRYIDPRHPRNQAN